MPVCPDRILIVRPSALGDVCRTVPAAVSLHRAYPEARIDWVVGDTFADAIRAHPNVDNVIPFPRSRFADWWRSPRVSRELHGWFRTLRAREYDLVFDLQGLSRSALITAMTGAPRRVGFASAREMAWVGYNIKHPPPTSTHIVDQMLELLNREGIEPVRDMKLYVPAEDELRWQQQAIELGLRDTRYAVFAPTTRWASKRWPPECWQHLVSPLLTRGIDRLVVVGAPNERDQITSMVKSLRNRVDDCVIDLVGTTSVGTTMAVIRDASLVIANDSAPLHMAVGFDRPLIALFGPTDPEFVGPYDRLRSVVRVYDAHRDGRTNFRALKSDDSLMRRITPEMIIEQYEHLYAGSPSTNATGS